MDNIDYIKKSLIFLRNEESSESRAIIIDAIAGHLELVENERNETRGENDALRRKITQIAKIIDPQMKLEFPD